MSPAPRTHSAHPNAWLRADPRATVGRPFVWFSSRALGLSLVLPQLSPQHHHAPRLGPPTQLQFGCQALPWCPASTHSFLPNKRSINFFTFAVCFSLNR